MARKSYTEEFRRQAVDLYEATPGATLKGIAADLGLSRGTLQGWVALYGSGPSATKAVLADRPESKAARMARLEAENLKLTRERDILRAAAKYFAGETIW